MPASFWSCNLPSAGHARCAVENLRCVTQPLTRRIGAGTWLQAGIITNDVSSLAGNNAPFPTSLLWSNRAIETKDRAPFGIGGLIEHWSLLAFVDPYNAGKVFRSDHGPRLGVGLIRHSCRSSLAFVESATVYFEIRPRFKPSCADSCEGA
jgi:hypothetical protein